MYQQKQKFQNLLLMIIDAVCIVASYLFARFCRLKFRPNPMGLSMNDVVGSLWLVFLAYFCVFIFFNMNQYLMQRDKYEELLIFITLIDTISLTNFTRRKKKEELYSLFRILFVLLSIHVFALMLLFYCKDIFANQEDLLYIDGISYISTCNLPVILYFISFNYENKDIKLKIEMFMLKKTKEMN